MHYLEPVDRNQFTFMNRLDDLVDADNEVRLIDLLIDKILEDNMDEILPLLKKGHSRKGRKAYGHPTLLKIFLYGYLNSINTSRCLMKECKRNIEMIWLTGSLKPDFKTIADFRKDNGQLIEFINKKFRDFLKSTNYISGQTIAIDGSKIKAYTKRDMLNTEKLHRRMEKIGQKIEDYLNLIYENDIKDELSEELSELENSEDINQYLVEKIVKYQKQLEEYSMLKEQLAQKDSNHISASDVEANLMKSRDGYIPAYNVQIAVDSKNKMIASTEVSTESNDKNLLKPMFDKVDAELQGAVKEILADKGYDNLSHIERIEKDRRAKCFIPLSEQSSSNSGIEFEYDDEADEYRCSQGKRLILISHNKNKRGRLADVYQGIECEGCAVRDACTKSKKGRILHRFHDEKWRRHYKDRLKLSRVKRKISYRKTLVEHPFGVLKYWMGKLPLKMRGKQKVATEINLYAMAYNLRRLLTIEKNGDIQDKLTRYKLKAA
jgi:transposase